MATTEDTVIGPGSWPADVPPTVAVKRKLSAVSWPFRALGTEGAQELLPGPVPTLLKRCKQGPVLGEGTNWRKEAFSAGRDVRGGRRCREAMSQITLAEKEIGLINEEKASSSRWKSLRNIFQVAYFLQVLNFHSAHNSSPPALTDAQRGAGERLRQRIKSAFFDTAPHIICNLLEALRPCKPSPACQVL